MILTPGNEFGLIIKSNTSRPPGAGAIGLSVTPGNNTYGSYVQLIAGASVTADVYGIWINFCSGATSASARDIIATIGLDAAGGTTYTDTIQHLIASCADLYYYGGVNYFFPLFIKAGTSIGVKASVNNATVGTVRCQVKLFCQPRRPEAVPVCTFVETLGAVTGSSRGTLVTSGTTAEGAWTAIGSALDLPLWGLEFGVSMNTAAMDSACYHLDIGAGADPNERIIVVDHLIRSDGTEAIYKPVGFTPFMGAVGDQLYARLQYGSTGDNAPGVAIYGCGGGNF